jgi:hypothetical protein
MRVALALVIALIVLGIVPVAAEPVDSELGQRMLEGPSLGTEPFVVVRAEDGQVFSAELRTAQHGLSLTIAPGEAAPCIVETPTPPSPSAATVVPAVLRTR